MIDLSDHDRQVLSRVGQGAYGSELKGIVLKLKNQICSLENIDTNRDYNPQVEGRLLFKTFADELMSSLSYERHTPRKREQDDYS